MGTTRWRLLAALCVMTLVAAGCSKGNDAGTSSGPLQELGDNEGQLNIIAWAGYIERGDTDKAYDWGDLVRERDGLQGQRQGRRDLRRDGGPQCRRGRASTW